jgi:3D (Asp-Asp-Asp) domain-containing protein
VTVLVTGLCLASDITSLKSGLLFVPKEYMNTHTLKAFLSFISMTLLVGAAQATKLDPTIYFIKSIDLNKQCAVKRTIYSTDGKAIEKVCAIDYKTCVIEGTCALIDKSETQVINYVDERKGVYLFKEVEKRCPYGYGVKNICLDPYYTVAADLNFHRPGEVIFIDKVKGTKLPNGEVHDGFFIVRDRGGAIKGANRFDFYTGLLHYKNDENPFTPLGLAGRNQSESISFRMATKLETLSVKEKRKFPELPL